MLVGRLASELQGVWDRDERFRLDMWRLLIRGSAAGGGWILGCGVGVTETLGNSMLKSPIDVAV
ncbi:hypothetical protein E2C01_041236 [Portunus trituberculatus]|uniref:Uncharacterized protein n=1 Tax=Portunus trituberculatus TaxID=210409 RepID=A0A5B7FQ57_PORTR|nr:hypothetical protein [Portunus trituberculatus]